MITAARREAAPCHSAHPEHVNEWSNQMLQPLIQYGQYAQTRNGEDGPYFVTVDTFHIGVSDEDGFRWVLADSETEDESEVEHIMAHLDHDPSTRPDAWVSVEPVYGSRAWDEEAEFNLAQWEAEKYGEPSPQW